MAIIFSLINTLGFELLIIAAIIVGISLGGAACCDFSCNFLRPVSAEKKGNFDFFRSLIFLAFRNVVFFSLSVAVINHVFDCFNGLLRAMVCFGFSNMTCLRKAVFVSRWKVFHLLGFPDSNWRSFT